MATHGGPNIVDDGLVFYVDPANKDSYISGSLDTLTLIPSSSITLTGSIHSDVNFNFSNGGSWEFDGTDDIILFTTGSSIPNPIAVPYNQDPLTISCWIKPNGNSEFIRWGNYGFAPLLIANVQSNTTLRYYVRDAYITVDDSITQNSWHNIVFSREAYNSDGKVYVNGVEVSTQWTGGAPNPNNVPEFKYSRYFIGNLGPLSVYTKKLSATEVLQNYNALKGRFRI